MTREQLLFLSHFYDSFCFHHQRRFHKIKEDKRSEFVSFLLYLPTTWTWPSASIWICFSASSSDCCADSFSSSFWAQTTKRSAMMMMNSLPLPSCPQMMMTKTTTKTMMSPTTMALCNDPEPIQQLPTTLETPSPHFYAAALRI